MTKGQYSPTSDKGFVTKTTLNGSIEESVNPIAIAIAQGATFVSRGFAGDMKHLTWLIEQALQHKGYSLVDVFQPCVSFNRMYSYDWLRPRVYNVQEEPEYDPGDTPDKTRGVIPLETPLTDTWALEGVLSIARYPVVGVV